MTRLALLVVCLLLQLIEAHAQLIDNAWATGLYFDTRSNLESTRKLLYYLTKMHTASNLYDHDHISAMRLIGQPDLATDPQRRDIVLSLYGTKAAFMAEYAPRVDQEIAGSKFGDLPLSSITNIGIAAVGLWAGGGLTGATGTFYAQAAVNGYQISPPMSFDSPTSADFVYPTILTSLQEADSDSALGPFIRGAYIKYGGISDLSGMKNTLEYKSFLLANNFQELKHSNDELKVQFSNLSSRAAEGIDKLAKLQQEKLEISKEILENQSDEEASDQKREAKDKDLKDNRDKKDDALRALQASAGTMEQIGRLIGADPQTMRALRGLNQAAVGAMEIYIGDPSGYFVATTALLSMLGPDQSDNANVEILSAITNLARQIDALKDEMLLQFANMNGSISVDFSHQESLLQAILLYQKGQTYELNRIKSLISRANVELREAMDAYAMRTQKTLWTVCLNIKSDESNLARECSVNAFNLATSGAWDVLSVANSLLDIVEHYDAEQIETNSKPGDSQAKFNPTLIQSQTELNRLSPLIAKVRFGSQFEMPNPQQWVWGASLMSHMFQVSPEQMRVNYGEDWATVAATGHQIQAFFQEAFTEKYGSGQYKIDPTLIVRQVNNYTEAAANYSREIGEVEKRVDYPFQRPNQPLPDETVTELQNNKSSAPVDMINFSDVTLPSERGNHDAKEAKAAYHFLNFPIPLCPALLQPDVDPYYFIPFVSPAAPAAEFYTIKKGQRLLDASVLPLIPRQALWLERIDPNRFEVKVCFSRYSVRYDPGQQVLLEDPDMFSHPPLDLVFRAAYISSLEFLVDDKLTGEVLNVGSANMGLKLRVPATKAHYLANFANLTSNIWTGFCSTETGTLLPAQKCTVRFGPILNNIDKYFIPTSATPGVINSIKHAASLIETYRQGAINDLEAKLVAGGPVVTARQEAYGEFRVLKCLRAFNFAQIDEVGAMIDLMDRPITLLAPDQISRVIENGVTSEDIVHSIHAQSMKYRRALLRLSGDRVLAGPVPTPVDATIAELEVLRQNLNPPTPSPLPPAN